MVETKDSPVLLIIGTRPEGIKMAPVYHALKRAGIPTTVCSTMQHNQLLLEVLDLFDIVPDISLNIMRSGQDLFYLTQAVLQKTKETFLSVCPSLILVQGDTTSSMAAAMAAFYLGIPIGHVEAGLRTDDILAPFPEEMNRRLISMISTYHFAPTPAAVANLLAQGVKGEKVFCTGNTVVDALHSIQEKIHTRTIVIRSDIKERVISCRQKGRDIALLTVHRRESFNGPIENILRVVKEWALKYPDTEWFYPYHPNPNVVNAIRNIGLMNIPNLYLCEPLSYKELVYLLDAASYVLTDSGGIQEEAISLGKPVLVLREKTERMEGILIGGAYIVGSDAQVIRRGMEWAVSYQKRVKPEISQVYGDGHAAERIVAFIQAQYDQLCGRTVQGTLCEQITVKPKERDTTVKKVSVLGLGYIGLPTAIVAAEAGNSVVGFDIDLDRISEINGGNPIIHEPEAYEKLRFVLGSRQFYATASIEPADYFIIAVPTPITSDKKANLDHVYAAVDSLSSVLCPGNVVIVESTIPVGVTQKVASRIAENTGLKEGKDFFVAYCPERVLPGNIFHELVSNDRIIGGFNQASAKQAKRFYKQFVTGQLYTTTAETAEMVKLIENSARDSQLAFAHQVSSMATAIGLDPYEVIELANKHPRVKILRPTCGVGGHCIAVDPWFLVESFPRNAQFIRAAREVNDAKPREVISSISRVVDGWRRDNLGICTVLLLGVGYKPNVEDLRESPALAIAQHLVKDSAMRALITDPHVDRSELDSLFGDRVVSMIGGLEQADIVVFLVAHDRFKLIDRKLLEHKRVIDFCGALYDPLQSVRDKDDEEIYWPSRGAMDFFIVNQNIKSESNSS